MLGLHWNTIFSFSFYHRLTKTTKWQAVWFVVYLFLLCMLVFNLFVSGYVSRQLPLMLKNFPEVTFDKGRLSAPQEPVSFAIPQSGFSILFDASLQAPPAKEVFINKNLAAIVGPDGVYMPTVAGVQKQNLPENFSFSTTQEFLQKNQAALAGTINAIAFMAAFIVIPMMFFFFFCAAMTAGLFFRMVRREEVPLGAIARWAIYLMGPLSVLWFINLFIGVPLFTLAVLVVCIIYMQQIFNTLPEGK